MLDWPLYSSSCDSLYTSTHWVAHLHLRKWSTKKRTVSNIVKGAKCVQIIVKQPYSKIVVSKCSTFLIASKNKKNPFSLKLINWGKHWYFQVKCVSQKNNDGWPYRLIKTKQNRAVQNVYIRAYQNFSRAFKYFLCWSFSTALFNFLGGNSFPLQRLPTPYWKSRPKIQNLLF